MDSTEFAAGKAFVDTPSGRIAYVERGEGPVALFVHGVLVNSWIWRNQIEALSDIRRCIAIDIMGHGATEVSATQDLSSGAQAVMVGQVLDALGIDQVDLIGNDGGGGVSQIFAANNPASIRSLTLTDCDTYDNWPPVAFQGFVDMCAAGGLRGTLSAMLADKAVFREGLAAAYQDAAAVSDDTVEAYLRPYFSPVDRVGELERFVAAFDCADTMAVEPKLRELKAPTLIVWGTDDVFFDVKWAHWLAERIPGVRRCVELKDGRLFFFEERAAEFNAELRAHLIAG